MPIYEYRCADCHRKVSIFWRSLSAVDETKARCTRCGSANLTRVMSRVRMVRGGSNANASRGGEDGPDLPPGAEDRMMRELEGIDENDPRSLGRFMRRMAAETGESLGEEFEEVVGRLESGEDPDRIEERMGDMFGDDMGGPGGMGGMGGYDDMGMSGMGMPSAPAPAAEADTPAPKEERTSKTIGMAISNPKPQPKPTSTKNSETVSSPAAE
ncbi:MAG: zinc ribbon domain-containing protein [Anaerolineae bacterium]|nr:zinc ribbon domain-containing protein [Anaerolineae bacterium]